MKDLENFSYTATLAGGQGAIDQEIKIRFFSANGGKQTDLIFDIKDSCEAFNSQKGVLINEPNVKLILKMAEQVEATTLELKE